MGSPTLGLRDREVFLNVNRPWGGHRANKHTDKHTAPSSHDHHTSRCPTAPYGTSFDRPTSCQQAHTAHPSQPIGASRSRHACYPNSAHQPEIAAVGHSKHRETRHRARHSQPIHTQDCRDRCWSSGTPAADTAAAQARKSGQKPASQQALAEQQTHRQAHHAPKPRPPHFALPNRTLWQVF